MFRLTLSLAIWFSLFLGPVAADADLEKLIEDLAKVSEPGVGYSATLSGTHFLPYNESETLNSFIQGGAFRAKSETMLKIIRKGPNAVLVLLKHLKDDRKIALEPIRGMQWMAFKDEYDFNRRTRSKSPLTGKPENLNDRDSRPDSYAITNGDLCFVAIGQIVNRNYSAARYQPSGGIVVNSTRHSKRLHDALITEWNGLTTEKHRRLLIEDFEKPDKEDRRIGAYWRLCYYYPDQVEALLLKSSELLSYDMSKIRRFCRDILYPSKPLNHMQLYNEFIRENGKHYESGVVEQLFSDLSRLEAHEEGRISPPLTEFRTEPRDLLVELFYKPASVKSSDRPVPDIGAKARFIGGLTHDDSKWIGEVVKEIYLKNTRDVTLAPACLRCLANRGYGPFLVEQLNKIDYSKTEENYLNSNSIEAIATSKEPKVRERLLRIIKETSNESFFMEALSGLEDAEDLVVWKSATRILGALPDETNFGKRILKLIATRFPDKAENSFQMFLAKNSTKRVKTMCDVLWYGHPLSPKILAPFLDDKRELTGLAYPTRVCDLAAQVISHRARAFEFDSEWPQEKKDEAILKLKEFCKNRK